MTNVAFVVCFGAVLSLALRWAYRTLPKEGWQILATLPLHKDANGRWVGVNLTYYGLITASATLVAVATFLVLMGAIQVPLRATLAAVAAVLLTCIPAASFVAHAVEKKPHTFSVGGAVAVGLLVAPGAVLAMNRVAGGGGLTIPMVPAVAAMGIAYVIGEGVGRLACISFGCCYGKPLSVVAAPVRALFERFDFAFHGETKKIAYASGLEGIKVVPIQVITAGVHFAIGLAGMLLFLETYFAAALSVTIVLSQLWRAVSETLRADHRGVVTRLSAYQKLALGGAVYGLVVVPLFPSTGDLRANLAEGLATLWDPSVIVVLQAIWFALFVRTGWSMVTGSSLTFHVHRDRI